jgi:hypothetical protein
MKQISVSFYENCAERAIFFEFEFRLVTRVDTKFRDTKFREISHQELVSYFAKFSIYFAKFREISRPSFAKFRERKMEIVGEISRN